MIIEQYKAALKAMDWYYDYSECGRTWKDGDAAYKQLVQLHRDAVGVIGRREADYLWVEAAPQGFRPPLGLAYFSTTEGEQHA